MSESQELHSKLSMSARSRWSRCAVSVPWSEGMPDDSGPAAEEGTIAHRVAEFYVRQRFGLEGTKPGIPPEYQPPEGLDLKGQTVNAWNAKLRLHGQDYAAFIAGLVANYPDAVITLEKRVEVKGINPPLFGTADCLIWVPSIEAIGGCDYKYGFGEVEVGTPEAPNEQVAGYVVGAAETYNLKPKKCLLAIYQPRRIHGAPGQVLVLDGEWLEREHAKIILEGRAVEAAYAGLNIVPVPGPHCRYCKASRLGGKCPVVPRVAQTALEAHARPTLTHDMSDDEIVALWATRSAFKNFWEDVEARIDKMATAGAAGLVVTVAKGRRMWANPQDAVFTLLALGRTDLLAPVAIGEALPAIPEAAQAGLAKLANGARTINATAAADPHTVAATFAKYAGGAS